MRTRTLLLGGLVLAAIARAATAEACGGCFQPPAVDSVVTGHRMAFAVSESRTVLWDQIQYNGDPGDFGWVLPVAPGATLELSTTAWFEALEAATGTQISPPALKCATNDSGGCLGHTSEDGSPGGTPQGGGSSGPEVTVLDQATLGPYEQVTLRSSDAGSLRDWLGAHGYAIQSDVDPIIDAYIAAGMDFIALRLHGNQPMQPVRVVTPSGAAVLPLRMVMAGTGSAVDVVLYAIGEKRLGLADLTEGHLDLAPLAFDFASGATNYGSVRSAALEENLGATFLTTFASKNPFGANAGRVLLSSANKRSTTLGQLYFDQGFANESGQEPACSVALTGLTNDREIADAEEAQAFACGDLTDLSAAMIGMHPSRVWLSRLEMHLPREALSMDCRVRPTKEQTEVSSNLIAVRAVNRPSTCIEPLFESRISRERVSPPLSFAWAMAGAAAVGLLRRLRRRR